MAEQTQQFTKSQQKWTDFHQEKSKVNYPKWPVEVMVKTLFGSYLERRPNLQPGQCVLDVGCGFGNNLLPFLDAGYKAYGVEISEDIAQLTQKILSEKGFETDIRAGSNRNLPFESRQFDLLISNNVLHYESDEANILKAFKEYHRVLRADGTLFLMTVGPEHMIYQRAECLGDHRYRIKDYDFRNGETYFYFDNEKYLRHYLSRFFGHIEIGRVTEKLMTVNLDFFVAVCADPLPEATV